MLKSPMLMYAYAVFLIVCALITWALSGFAAGTALIPVALGAIMALMGWMAGQVEKNRAVGMIGIHVGLVLPVLYALMFGWLVFTRGIRAEEPVVYQVTMFTILLLGSIAAFIAILMTRPKPEARG